MKSMVNRLVFLVLATVGLPVYAANFTVDANMHSLDLVVDKSPDGQVHIIKNFDEAYFNYSENIDGDTIRLVSDAETGINSDLRNGRITYVKNRGDRIVRNERARVTVQVPDDAAIKFVSLNGGITVNDIDCTSIDVKTNNGDCTLNRSSWDSIQLDTKTGSIYYTGGIEGKSIDFETGNGNINIVLEAGSEVDVDIQSRYSYRQHLPVNLNPGPGRVITGGGEKTGYSTGRITSKRGTGVINAVTRTGVINCDVLN